MAKLNAAKPDVGIQLTAQVEREIAAVAKKIRMNDLVTGAALLIVGTLAYAVVALLLDKWLVLPAWIRQLEFLGFVTALLGLSYFALVRPLMRVVNPRYVARQVEATMPQSKNELINWVDLQEQEMAGSVKSALASRAAAGFGNADVESAVRSRKFLWLGGTAAVLVAALSVMFLVFKGTQFGSLLTRAFNPFHSTVIAARTTIDVIEPGELDATVADGDQIRFAVRLGGRVPDANAGDKVRLKIRYNADATDTEEIAFAKTVTLRDFELILTRGTIQNGFWYTIAAGDAETAEHRVTVRTKPMLKGFDVKYEYPAYLRIAPSGNADPKLRGYPGTKVTLQVQTNREVKSGTMMIEPRGEAVEAKVAGEKNDGLRFEKVLDRPGQYRIAFASTAGESSGSSIPYPIEILPDFVPVISIEKPATDEITLAANGLLEVDATVTDDFGIENTTLQFSLTGGPKIAGKKYLGANSFKREKDGTFPTRVEYKDSVKLDQLKDETGKTVALKAGQVLEFWLEAKDNCTVLPHDLGKSKRIRVVLVAPPAKPEETKKQEQQAQERKKQDEQFQQREKDKQNNEPREAPKDPNQKGEPGEKTQDQNAQPMPGGTEKGTPDPMMNPEPKPNDGDVQKKAEELQNKIDEKNAQAGEAKPNPNAEKSEGEGQEPPKAGEKKMGEPMKGDAESKPGEGTEGAGENKDAGRVKPQETSESKPEPNQKPGDETRPEAQPQGNTPKGAPKQEDKPGEEKQSEGMQPKDEPKPGEKPQEGQAGGGKNEQPQKTDTKPDTAKAKPNAPQKPGEEKEAPKPDAGGDETMPPEERPATSKDQKPPDAGSSKQDKNGGKLPMDAGNEKPAPSPESMKPSEESGAEKGEGATQDNNAKGDEKSVPQPGDKSRKPTKEEIDQLTKDAKDLNSAEPDKKRAAEEKLDKAVGKENREKLQQQMKDREAANEKKLEDAAKQQGGKEPTKDELDELKKNAKDLTSENPEQKKAAEEKLDKSVGKENREKLQREMNGGKTEDRKKLEGDADQVARNPKGPPEKKEPTKEDLDELAKKAKDLDSPDPAKKKEAEQKVDEAIGKDARERMQKEMKEKAAAQSDAEKKKAEDAAKRAAKAEADKTGAKPKEPTKEEIEQIAKDAKDLNSDDAAKKKTAEEKLDKSIGKDAREQLQKDQKAMQDGAAQKAQEQRDDLEKMAKAAAKKGEQPKGKGPTKEQIDELAKDAKDLNSDDPAKKRAAEQKLDNAVGKDAREQMQKEMKEQADAKAAADKKKVEELAKKAPKEPTKEEVEQLAKDAKNLNSPDAERKKAAEEKLDKALGKDAREQLQKDLKDIGGDDPQKAQEARDRLEKMAKDAQAKNPTKDWNPGGNGGKEQEEKPLIDNPENRLKAAELQLDDFKKYRGDKKFLRESGMTDADYEKFLKGYEESVERQRKDVEQAKLNPEQARPTGASTTGRNDAGGGRVKGGPEAGTAPAAGGPSFAPPGFSEAQRDFAKEARDALERTKNTKK